MIFHRLASAKMADKIYVFKDGTVLKTILLSTKDIFSAMPGITVLTLVFQLLSAVVSIVMVSMNARLIDSAENVTDPLTLLRIVFVLIVGYYL